MEVKRQIAKKAYENGDYIKAMRIVKRFTRTITKDEKRTLEIAYECLHGKSDFYKGLGMDIDLIKFKANKIIESYFKKIK